MPVISNDEVRDPSPVLLSMQHTMISFENGRRSGESAMSVPLFPHVFSGNPGELRTPPIKFRVTFVSRLCSCLRVFVVKILLFLPAAVVALRSRVLVVKICLPRLMMSVRF